MSLDKTNSKLLVEIKKLHVPDDPMIPQAQPPASIHELDLVNGGDDISPGNSGGAAAANSNAQDAGGLGDGEGNEGGGDGYDLC